MYCNAINHLNVFFGIKRSHTHACTHTQTTHTQQTTRARVHVHTHSHTHARTPRYFSKLLLQSEAMRWPTVVTTTQQLTCSLRPSNLTPWTSGMCASFLSSVGNSSGCTFYLYSFVLLVGTPIGVVIHCHTTMLAIPVYMCM